MTLETARSSVRSPVPQIPQKPEYWWCVVITRLLLTASRNLQDQPTVSLVPSEILPRSLNNVLLSPTHPPGGEHKLTPNPRWRHFVRGCAVINPVITHLAGNNSSGRDLTFHLKVAQVLHLRTPTPPHLKLLPSQVRQWQARSFSSPN